MLIKEIYRNLERQIINKKKFRILRPAEKESTLKIAGVIANVVDIEHIEIETDECDIYFKDHDKYYLEVKTPQFFKGDRGDYFSRITNKHLSNLTSNAQRELLGIFIKPNKKVETLSYQLKEPSDFPRTVIGMDSKFISDDQVYRKLDRLLEKAASQLENLSDGRKIAIIDLVYLFRANFTTERVLFELVNDTDFLERIDAVSLFYHDQGRNAHDPLPFTIGPIIMKKPWKNMSKVFDHPYLGYSGNLLIVTPSLIEDISHLKGNPGHGDFRISGVDKQTLFDMFQRFDELDSDTRSTRTHRMFTHFYEQEYDLGD